MGTTTGVTQPADPYLNSLVGNTRWVGNVTFSFPNSASDYEAAYSDPPDNEPATFGVLNATQQAAARSIFQLFASVVNPANLTFSENVGATDASADIRMAESDAPGTAWAYGPSTSFLGGDVWFNKADYNTPAVGNYAWVTFIHEMGHSVGLNHPHDNGMPADRDSLEFTVMTYRSFIGDDVSGYNNEGNGYPQSLMMYDIASLQYMYGANFNTNSGNTTYSWNQTTGEASINGVGRGAPGGNVIFETVWDGNGVDTYDFSNYTVGLTVDLSPGGWSVLADTQRALLHGDGSQVARGSVFNALMFQGNTQSLIENANGGSAGDNLTGNAVANVLSGNGGNDSLFGGGGNDTLLGGTSVDTGRFSGNFADYRFEMDADGAIHVIDNVAGRDGSDLLREVENLSFADRTVSSTSLPIMFESQQFVLGTFGATAAGGGWTSFGKYPRQLADVNGDGKADIVGFGSGGVFISLATTGGNFGPEKFAFGSFGGDAGGWTSYDKYPRQMADVNGDGRADIVGFGEGGVFLSLNTGGDTFGSERFALGTFGGGAGGWTSYDKYPRQLADVNGDGRADIVGFGESGVFVALATGGGNFGPEVRTLTTFGYGAGGWTSQDKFPRQLADVNGDGMADIVGFGEGGVFVALATGGGNFGAERFAFGSFGGGAGGWTSYEKYPRRMADVNGDGKADIVGFGISGVFVSLATGGGSFGPETLAISAFGSDAGGWTSFDKYPRLLGDVNGDGRADILGFGDAGVWESLARVPPGPATGFEPNGNGLDGIAAALADENPGIAFVTPLTGGDNPGIVSLDSTRASENPGVADTPIASGENPGLADANSTQWVVIDEDTIDLGALGLAHSSEDPGVSVHSNPNPGVFVDAIHSSPNPGVFADADAFAWGPPPDNSTSTSSGEAPYVDLSIPQLHSDATQSAYILLG